MRNLRQLFRRSALLFNDKRRGRSEQKRRGELSQRRLSSEVLEKRQLLAGDILTSDINPNQNYWNKYDVDDNGRISASDAVKIINRLNVSGEPEVVDADAPQIYLDVNGDFAVTAGDALAVINAMSRGEEVGEKIEFLLTARDLNDAQILPDANGNINVGVNQPFDLEVSYDDLRLFNSRLGAFQLFTDISVSQGGVLTPILTETQRLIVDGAVTSAPFPTSVTFTIPTAPPGITGGALTFTSPFADFAGSTQNEVIKALLAFGYTRSQFEISSLDFGNDDIGFEIHWLGDQFGNVDLPNIAVEVNEASGGANVATQTVEFGVNDPASVRFNINTFSRTFNDNEEFYSSQNRGSFDSNTGFIGVGGLGQVPLEGGGIPQLTDDGSFPEPFDAFSLRVVITQPVTGLVVGVNPGEDSEATLLYGEDNAVPQDMVLIETTTDSNGNGLANLRINAGSVSSFVAGDAPLAVTEDTPSTALNLSTLITGGPADTFVITTNGTRGSAVITGTNLVYTPNLNATGTDTIVYTATAGTASDTGTITVTITGVNDAPVANDDSGPVVAGLSTTQNTALSIPAATLLANDTDADGNTLTITAVGAPANTNATAVLSGTTITYTPATGFTGTDTFTYTISDGNGGTDMATVTVSITGVVVAPVAGDSSLTLAEDPAAPVTLNLATLNTGGAADSFAITVNGSRGNATINGSILSYTPTLNANGNDSITYRATNSAGTDTGTIALTITPVNDAPVANDDSGPGVAGLSTAQNTALSIPAATLLANDTDADGNTLTITTVGGSTRAVLSGTTITYTPATGFTGNDTFTYTISDGNGGTDTLNVTQGAAGTLNLSSLVTGTAPTLTVTTQGTKGTAVITGTTLTYTPTAGQTGADTIVYTATNSAGSDTGTITVTINAANTLVAADGALNGTEDTVATINLASLITGATNPTITISTNGTIGNATISGTTLTYTPNANANGTDTIVYTATSGANSDSGTISVTIAAVNDAPAHRMIRRLPSRVRRLVFKC
jgi:Bacterial Ig domain/Dockerin type I domain